MTGPPSAAGLDATTLEAARYQGRRLTQITTRLLAGSRATSADGNAPWTHGRNNHPDRVSGGLARRNP